MKSIFTLLFAMAFSFLSAQTLELNMYEAELAVSEYLDYGDVLLTNTGAEDVELAVRLEQVCLNEGDATKIGICVELNCFLPVNVTTTWGEDTTEPLIIVGAGETSDFFKFSLLTQGDHASEWNVVIFERGNETNQVVLHVVIDDPSLEGCTPTSTNDFAYSIGNAFPNPATDMINIAYQIDINDAQLNIYNSLGGLVETVAVSAQAETVAVDVADFVDGVYFYNITDGKEQSKMMSFVK